METLFSIIIPAYNRAYILPETIGSVRLQTFAGWEVIVVDDGSADNTREVVTALAGTDPRIRYLYQENAERSVARNNGAKNAKGKYLLFLDSDDLYAPDHLQHLHDFLLEWEFPIAMVFTNLKYLTGQGLEQPEIPTMKREEAFLYLLHHPVTPSRVCIHRDIFTVFRFDPEIVIVEDLVLWVCIASRFPVFHLPVFSLHYRIHGGNSVDLSRDSYTSRLKGLYRLFGHPQYTAVARLISRESRRHLLAECYFNIARHCEYVRKYGRMNGMLLRSFLQKPGYRNKERLFMVLKHFAPTRFLLNLRKKYLLPVNLSLF